MNVRKSLTFCTCIKENRLGMCPSGSFFVGVFCLFSENKKSPPSHICDGGLISIVLIVLNDYSTTIGLYFGTRIFMMVHPMR